jgi:hypothetical protein
MPGVQAVEDKTFGMKNKKGAKGQQKVQQVKQSMEATAARAQGYVHHQPAVNVFCVSCQS